MNLYNSLEFKTLFLLNSAVICLAFFVFNSIAPAIKNTFLKYLLIYLGTPTLSSILIAIFDSLLYPISSFSFDMQIGASLGGAMGTLIIPYALFLLFHFVYKIVTFKKTKS